MKKIFRVLEKYSIRDLIPFAFNYFQDLILLSISSIIFRFKCFWSGVDCEGFAKIWGKFLIRKFPGSRIKIGKSFYAVCSPGRYAFNIYPQSLIRTYSSSAKVDIGDRVGLNSIAIFCRSQSIEIGDDCLIGGNCQITDNDGHLANSSKPRLLSPGIEFDKSVVIGKNVLIGLNVLILKGSIIGDNAVIAAGSIVNGRIPSNCLAAGVPAKVVKTYE